MAAKHNGTLVLARGQGFQTLWRETRKRIGDVCIAEAMTLPEAKFFFGQLRRRDTTLNDAALHVRQALKAVEEPASHTRDFVNLLNGPTSSEGLDKRPHTPVGRYGQPFNQRVVR